MLQGGFFLIALLVASAGCDNAAFEASLFCTGDLLRDVQLSGFFSNSKIFVDHHVRHNPAEVRAKYAVFQFQNARISNSERIKKFKLFISNNFDNKSGIEKATMEDWNAKPAFLKRIKNRVVRKFAYNINKKWPLFYRDLTEDARNNSECYSYIVVPHPFFIGSLNDNEMSYWHSFWIVKGLLVFKRTDSARNILGNLMNMVHKFKNCPMGNRVYYTNRVSVPLLVPMMDMYIKETGDNEYLGRHLIRMEIDFNTWLDNRLKVVRRGILFLLAVFNDQRDIIRPEKYLEDWEQMKPRTREIDTTAPLLIKHKEENFYTQKHIIPVYLNAITEWSARLLSQFCYTFNRDMEARKYHQLSNELKRTIETLLFNSTLSVWMDYDVIKEQHVDNFSLLHLTPLWTGTTNGSKGAIEQLKKYLRSNENPEEHPEGIDPAELQEIAMTSMLNLDVALARQIARRWIGSVEAATSIIPLNITDYDDGVSLISASVAIYMISVFPDIRLRDATSFLTESSKKFLQKFVIIAQIVFGLYVVLVQLDYI